MELVIISTIAAVAILIAELRDLVAGVHFARPSTATAARPIATVVDLASGNRAANEEPAAPRPKLPTRNALRERSRASESPPPSGRCSATSGM